MRDISDIRLDINDVDSRLKKLFLERMEYVDEVRQYKENTNTPVKNKEREDDILKSKLEGVTKFKNETKDFFKSVIEISCNYQDERLSNLYYENGFENVAESNFFDSVKKVCHQGTLGSYSYEVASKYFGNSEILSVPLFENVFQKVVNSECDIGVLPLENLSMGSVYDVYDLIRKNDVYITHCTELSINHCIAGVGKIYDIQTVFSHPQALGQCRKYILEQGFDASECVNTAISAMHVAKENNKAYAAICSIECAKLYGLNVLAKNISNIENNKTRFVFISKKPVIVGTSDKISLVFTAKHESGSLARILNDFAKNGINLLEIQSRPSDDDEWKYVFYVDIDMPDFDIMSYFSRIRYMFEDFKITGIYNTLG